MKLPRDIIGIQLVKLLSKYSYHITRNSGSHIRLTTLSFGEHHISIPNHDPMKIGTLSAILNEIAIHLIYLKNN